MKKIIFMMAVLSAGILLPTSAQTILSLEDCRSLAIENSTSLQEARTKVEMAEYDRKTALANYFPNISATGAYMHNSKNLALIPEDLSTSLTTAGTQIHSVYQAKLGELMQMIQSDPALAQAYMQSPSMQQFVQQLSQIDYSEAINQIGSQIDDALTLDINNIYVGAVTLQQPVFMGGKIVAANRVAKLAEELSRTQYDQKYEDILVEVDQAYWQIVSLSNKKALAESYAGLLHQMEKDVQAALEEGVATKSEELQIKVKANEADMLLTKAENGLSLSKMLLCKEIGLPLDSGIKLVDEDLTAVPVPEMAEEKSLEEIYRDRPETRSLELAEKIYDGKATMAKAEMIPKVILSANYLVTNPNMYHSFQNSFSGMWNAGVMVNIPIFHGFEALQKTRKAEAEASLYRYQMEDAKNLINLQVSQLRKQRGEAYEHLLTAESNLSLAEENLRTATLGFEAGVITTDTALAAQTAWLQAQSEYIDAGIELQMNSVNLRKAEGEYAKDLQ